MLLNIEKVVKTGKNFEKRFFNFLDEHNIEWDQTNENLNKIELCDLKYLKKIKFVFGDFVSLN